MVYQFVGIGQAGCSLLDSVFTFKNIPLFGTPTAINSTAKDLANLKIVKNKANWLGISAERGFVRGDEKGIVFEEIVTGGFGKNPVRGSEVVEEHYDSLLNALEARMKSEVGAEKSKKFGLKAGGKSETREAEHVPFSILFLSFGGGTGCGAAPYVAKALKELSEENMRIIVVGVLPAANQMLEAWNTRYGINELKKYTDSFILVDNERIAYRADYEALYPKYNDYVAASIVDLTAGILLEKIDPSEHEISPPVIDMNDVITATSLNGESCFATLGRTSMMSRSLPGYFIPIGEHKEIDTLTLCRLTVEKLTVANVDPAKTVKNLALLKVPPYYLKKEGRLDVKQLKEFMLERSVLGESHLGILLTKRNLVSLTTLFTHKYDDLDRLREIEHLAEEYEGRGGRKEK
jgi:hypothetical protein